MKSSFMEGKELSLHIRPDGSTRYNPEPDFKFIELGLSDEKAFGLDKSDVVVEQTPLLYNPNNHIELSRNQNK